MLSMVVNRTLSTFLKQLRTFERRLQEKNYNLLIVNELRITKFVSMKSKWSDLAVNLIFFTIYLEKKKRILFILSPSFSSLICWFLS